MIKIYGKVLFILFAVSLFFSVFTGVTYSQDNSTSGTVASSSAEADKSVKTQEELDEEARIKAQAEEEARKAKEEAKAALAEAEKAKKEAELQKKEAELERRKLEAELQEKQIAKEEAAAAEAKQETRRSPARVREEQRDDIEARSRIAAIEERLAAAQRKAEMAEEQMRLAQERMALAMARAREHGIKRDFVSVMAETAVIIFSGLALLMIMKLAGKKIEKHLTKKDVIRESELTLQIKTVVKLFNWLGTIVVIILIIYFVLESHGLDVAPLLAGAGIIGLAFGFGGQYLIRDLINGLFILIEGQYRINDVIKIGEYGGLVEDINLRITTLRDLEGRVIIIPNGEVKTVVNFTREYAQALLNIGVAYKENVDRVISVIKELGREIRQDPYFGRLILAELEMLGVEDFSDSAVIIRFRMKTLPIKQWEVMREFRRRLKNKFDELGIEIPFPHRTLYWGSGNDNLWMKKTAERFNPGN